MLFSGSVIYTGKCSLHQPCARHQKGMVVSSILSTAVMAGGADIQKGRRRRTRRGQEDMDGVQRRQSPKALHTPSRGDCCNVATPEEWLQGRPP